MQNESSFKDMIIDTLKEQGAYVIKYWGGGRFTKTGVPDLLVCIRGNFHGIELKSDRKGSVESKLQAYNLDRINRSGGFGYILRPTTKHGLKHPEFSYRELVYDEWFDECFGGE